MLSQDRRAGSIRKGLNCPINCEHIVSNIRQYIPLDEAEIDYLSSILISRPFKHGELIVRSGEPARHLIFANAGYLMTFYTDADGTDHVISFAGEGWWSGDVFSLSDEPVTRYSTRGLSVGEVLLLPKPAHQQLLDFCSASFLKRSVLGNLQP